MLNYNVIYESRTVDDKNSAEFNTKNSLFTPILPYNLTNHEKILISILLIFMQEQKIIKFFQKNIWSVRKMVVLLHPLSTEKQE